MRLGDHQGVALGLPRLTNAVTLVQDHVHFLLAVHGEAEVIEMEVPAEMIIETVAEGPAAVVLPAAEADPQ